MTLDQALRTIDLLCTYGNAKFGDEWWPSNASAWMPEGKELEQLLASRAVGS